MSVASGDAKNDSYFLSCELLGHSGDVRAVKFCPFGGSKKAHCILTASRDGTACVWEPDVDCPREYVLKKVVKKHTGFVTALCPIPASEEGHKESRLIQ